MRKVYSSLFIAFLFFSVTTSHAQVSAYTFSQSSGTYTPITGGTVLGNTSSDDERFVNPAAPLGSTGTLTGVGFPIGFTFTYNGIAFDRVAINNNGWISLGQSSLTPSVDINSTSIYTPLSSTATNTPSLLRNRIAGMGRDLQAQAGAELRIETIGLAPNRQFIVQYTNYKRFGTAGVGDNFNFQIILNETSNLVQVVYGTMVFNTTTTTSSIDHVGLGGTLSTDFNNRQTTAPHNWNTTTAGTTNAQGVQNATSTIAVTPPISGLTFTWTPPACAAPGGLNSSSLQVTGATIGWTAAGTATSYDWEIRTSGACGSGSPVQSGNTATTSVNLSGLTANTAYTYCVRSVCAGPSTSAWVSGTFTTLCTPTNVPFTQNFDAVTSPNFPSCLPIQNVNGATSWNMWYLGGQVASSLPNSIRYEWNVSTPADDWFYLQGLNLTAGTTYRLRFKYKGSDGPTFVEKLEVKYGSAPDAASMTAGTLFSNTNIITAVTSPFAEADVNFTPSSTGVFYLGFHAFSAADQAFLYIDDITVTEVPAIDIAPTAVIIPSFACPTSNVTVQATITNLGAGPLDFSVNPVTVTANITGAGTGTLTGASPATGILAAGASIDITLAPTFNFAAAGTYNISVTTAVTGDGNPGNDVFNTSRFVLAPPVAPVFTPATPAVCVGSVLPISVPVSVATFSSSSAITVPAGAPGNTAAGIASPYPVNLTVSGIPAGAIVKSVTINGIVHSFPDDLDILLQSPTGTNVVLMSDAGLGDDLTGQNYTFTDAAPALLADGALSATGTYRPTNYGTPETWPAPGPGSVSQATPLLSSFTGNFNGVWKLFVVDDANQDVGSISSWSITIEVPTAIWTPVTGLFSDPAGTVPYVAGTATDTVYAKPAATTTYSVTNTLGTCSAGPVNVTVTVNPVPTVSVAPNNQCGPVTLTATGNANTYTWSPAAGLSATTGATVTANPVINTTYLVVGTLTATGCTTSASVTVNATPAAPVVTPSNISLCAGATTQLSVQSVGSFTSSAAITITGTGPATLYPSAISVSGLPTTGGVTVRSVTINGISHTFPGDLDIVLQSPNGTNVILMSDAGGTNDIVNTDLVFSDAAAGFLPAAIVAGTYKPTNTAGPDDFPAPGPGSLTQVNPTLSAFGGNPNGSWNLYVVDDAAGDLGSITGWSITFDIAGVRFSPATGLYTDPGATVPYVANAVVSTVYAKPTTTTTYAVTRATATCTSPATNVVVTVLQPLTITTQPASQTVCQGTNVTFSIVLGGTNPTYQWEISTNAGVTWNPIAGANSSSLVLSNVGTALSGNRYRVVATNSCTTVTSNAATLTVTASTPATATPIAGKICLSDTLIKLNATPVGGNWTGVGVSGNNFVPMSTAVGTYTLTYTYTNAGGCSTSSSITAKVEDCPERLRLLKDDAVLLYPNPNNGRFNIKINSALYNYIGMKVYTADGQLVRTQVFNGLVYGRVIHMDLTNLPGGSYIVKFYYDAGNRTSDKAFKVIIGR